MYSGWRHLFLFPWEDHLLKGLFHYPWLVKFHCRLVSRGLFVPIILLLNAIAIASIPCRVDFHITLSLLIGLVVMLVFDVLLVGQLVQVALVSCCLIVTTVATVDRWERCVQVWIHGFRMDCGLLWKNRLPRSSALEATLLLCELKLIYIREVHLSSWRREWFILGLLLHIWLRESRWSCHHLPVVVLLLIICVRLLLRLSILTVRPLIVVAVLLLVPLLIRVMQILYWWLFRELLETSELLMSHLLLLETNKFLFRKWNRLTFTATRPTSLKVSLVLLNGGRWQWVVAASLPPCLTRTELTSLQPTVIMLLTNIKLGETIGYVLHARVSRLSAGVISL